MKKLINAFMVFFVLAVMLVTPVMAEGDNNMHHYGNVPIEAPPKYGK